MCFGLPPSTPLPLAYALSQRYKKPNVLVNAFLFADPNAAINTEYTFLF